MLRHEASFDGLKTASGGEGPAAVRPFVPQGDKTSFVTVLIKQAT